MGLAIGLRGVQSSHVIASNWWFKGDNVAESWVARAADAQRRRSEGGLGEIFEGVGDKTPEAGVVEGGGDLGVAGGVGRLAQVGDGHAGGQCTNELDVDGGLAGLDDVRIDEIGNGARVVDRWVIKALVSLVGLAEESEKAHDELGDGSI